MLDVEVLKQFAYLDQGDIRESKLELIVGRQGWNKSDAQSSRGRRISCYVNNIVGCVESMGDTSATPSFSRESIGCVGLLGWISHA